MTKWLLFVFSCMAVMKLIFFYSENNSDSLNRPPNTNLLIVQWRKNKEIPPWFCSVNIAMSWPKHTLSFSKQVTLHCPFQNTKRKNGHLWKFQFSHLISIFPINFKNYICWLIAKLTAKCVWKSVQVIDSNGNLEWHKVRMGVFNS